jgi:hypothetical protein
MVRLRRRGALVLALLTVAACADVWGFRDLGGPDGGASDVSTDHDGGSGSGSGSGAASGSSSGSGADSSSGSGSSSDASADNAAFQDAPDDTFNADAPHDAADAVLCCSITQLNGNNTYCVTGHLAVCGMYASCPPGLGSTCYAWPGCASEQSCCPTGCCDGVVAACQ